MLETSLPPNHVSKIQRIIAIFPRTLPSEASTNASSLKGSIKYEMMTYQKRKEAINEEGKQTGRKDDLELGKNDKDKEPNCRDEGRETNQTSKCQHLFTHTGICNLPSGISRLSNTPCNVEAQDLDENILQSVKVSCTLRRKQDPFPSFSSLQPLLILVHFLFSFIAQCKSRYSCNYSL